MKTMIKFADLETGNLFSGGHPYIHWFPKEQSINIIYTQPICFISVDDIHVITIEDNPVFNLVDVSLLENSDTETINGFEYHNHDNLKTNKFISNGVPYRNYYVHILYITALAEQSGEYIAEFYIDNDSYKIGADFYDENEILNINLANRGIELPNEIQKSFYDTNVHEDKIDNIVLNRKWKELLSNYWDVIANKGSYISLYNSLKWFEYGDLVSLCEVWKYKREDKDIYNIKSVQSILSDKFYSTLNSFSKTTYFALYCALEKPVVKNGNYVYDKEGNPVLKKISSKWSTVDLSLKLCLLGNFYETYFMPIHTELIHSTIEDVVYSNTIKLSSGVVNERKDYIDNVNTFNIYVDPVHYINRVQCYVGKDTIFGTPANLIEDVGIMGVQVDVPSITSEDELKQFVFQRYDELGSIINFKVSIPLNDGDKIKRSQIFIQRNDKQKCLVDNKILPSEFEFNILCEEIGSYKISIQFDSIFGNTYVKTLDVIVKDSGVSCINIYKIVPVVPNKYYSIDHNYNPFVATSKRLEVDYSQTYLLSNIESVGESYKFTQYIPSIQSDSSEPEGPQLSHMLIIKDSLTSLKTFYEKLMEYIEENYFTTEKNIDDDSIYTICIAKSAHTGYNPLDFAPKESKIGYNKLKNSNKIYRSDFIFVPEYHKIVLLGEGIDEYDINKYCIDKYTALCVIPDITLSKPISDWVWRFINQSRPEEEPIVLKHPIRNPLIAPDKPSFLTPGYYKVEFKYSLVGESQINTIVLDSAFIVR